MDIIRIIFKVTTLIAFFAVAATALAGNGKLVNATAPAPSLEHSLFQTSNEQPLAIYLPPSYDSTQNRYPVVYFLPGFNCPIYYFTQYGVFQGFDLKMALDSLINSGVVREMIVVIPNGLNFMGGSFYANSPLTGNWEDFIIKDVVGYVDSAYRTIRDPKSRGITGYSMGGSGALALAIKHPDIFGSVYALSPGILAPEGLARTDMFADTLTIKKYLGRQADFAERSNCDGIVRFMSFIDNLYKAGDEATAFAYAYGAAFAPDTSSKAPFIDYPYHLADGKLTIDSLVWKRYEEGFGDWKQKLAVYKDNLPKLSAIVIDYGIKDELAWIPTGCVYFSALLDSAGVNHQLLSFDGGHGNRVRERLEFQIFLFFSKQLKGEK